MRIPMGTVMTMCMLLGVLFSHRLPGLSLFRISPRWLRQLVGGILVVAACWDIFWYGSQHLGEFWGMMAIASGLLMLLLAGFLIAESKMPALLEKARPLLVLLLSGLTAYYAMTIYKMP
ncbi:MAG: hypothetical protein V3U76_05125 [Granulosicoccus sp.]